MSRVIKFFTRATVSHAYIVIDTTPLPEDGLVFEAAWCGFRMSTRGALTRGTTRIVKELPVDVDAPKALAIVRSWLETPYDYRGLLGEAFVQIGKLFGRRWNNVFASPHAMFCSEAATYLLQHTAINPLLWTKVSVLDARKVDPETLLLVLIAP